MKLMDTQILDADLRRAVGRTSGANRKSPNGGYSVRVNDEDARAWGRRLGIEAASKIRVREFRNPDHASGPIDVVDLFCGCGGLSSGFEAVGRLVPSYRLAGAVDFDEHCVRSYEANLGRMPVMADLTRAAESGAGVKSLVSQFNFRRR